LRVPAGETIRIDGIVQGVGFRPFVYRTARELGLTGWVRNDAAGVTVALFGPPAARAAFRDAVQTGAPPLAAVAAVRSEPLAGTPPDEFRILPSREEANRRVDVTPDAAVCADCRRELLDPADRRHRYPFINCTQCGPRYTIVEDVPYDRPRTTMKRFRMCAACAAEYEDPASRRHHAQPNCCPRCGPSLELRDAEGSPLPGDPVREAAARLRDGAIVAIKGLGGFHLACDATAEPAVRRLRERKLREEKPLAVMVQDLAAARALVELPAYGEEFLAGPAAPILVARRRPDAGVAPAVAPVNDFLGVMLPYTPLHLLLFAEGLGPLVMTSANRSDEPIVIDNTEARERLAGIADAFLLHDRPIHLRADDSVFHAGEVRPTVLRRARGYVPAGIQTGRDVEGWAGFGPLLKNAPALGRGSVVYPGQHVGDLDHPLSREMFREVYDHLRRLLGVEVTRVACDLHPEYPTTALAEATGLPVRRIQHHHAHLVALMAESRSYEPAIGFAFDGAGYGPDGTVWGGEVLVVEPGAYRRAYHLDVVPQPGGDKAAREGWRMAVSHLAAAGLDWQRYVRHPRAADVAELLRSAVPQPRTSSMGRLFDAVAALTGLRDHSAYEGQAAMMLEGAAAETEACYEAILAGGCLRAAPVLAGIVRDLDAGVPAGVVSGKFHNTVASWMVAAAVALRGAEGLETVLLSGGVFQNARLTARARARLAEEGFTVRTHALLPPNDGGIAVGQVVAAAAGAGASPAAETTAAGRADACK
jgi:hydrogenase maturation protein HypF